MIANHAPRELRRRLPRLLPGLVLCGVGIASMVAADLGLSPWDVFHQGVARRTGLPIGTVTILVGLGVLAAWLPLRERPGVGTVCNVLVIGLVVDLTLLALETPEHLGLRVAMMAAGPLLFGVGSGLYIGAGLGPGPRDGLMTGLARRTGWSVGAIRTALEVGVLSGGWLLGGTVGVGTVLFALGIGPVVHLALRRLTVADAPDGVAAPTAGAVSDRAR